LPLPPRVREAAPASPGCSRCGPAHALCRSTAWRVPHGVDPSIDVHYGIAVLTAGSRVYALRVDTGRLVTLARAPTRARAQIEEPGVVYQYNTSRGGVMRFVSLERVERALR